MYVFESAEVSIQQVNGQVEADIMGVGRMSLHGNPMRGVGCKGVPGMYGFDFQAIFRRIRHGPYFLTGVPAATFCLVLITGILLAASVVSLRRRDVH